MVTQPQGFLTLAFFSHLAGIGLIQIQKSQVSLRDIVTGQINQRLPLAAASWDNQVCCPMSVSRALYGSQPPMPWLNFNHGCQNFTV